MQLGNECGSFLVCYGDNSPGKHALSIRDVERVKHYKIHKLDDGSFFKFFTSLVNFKTIPELGHTKLILCFTDPARFLFSIPQIKM